MSGTIEVVDISARMAGPSMDRSHIVASLSRTVHWSFTPQNCSHGDYLNVGFIGACLCVVRGTRKHASRRLQQISAELAIAHLDVLSIFLPYARVKSSAFSLLWNTVMHIAAAP